MQLGYFLIAAGLIASLISIYFYNLAAGNGNISRSQRREHGALITVNLQKARISFYASVAAISLASVYLLFLILSHKFQVDYIYRYSSSDLPLGYLISVFWAGQEGSFLFWLLSLTWMGYFMQKSAGTYEARSMIYLNLVQVFFFIILFIASPFKLLPQVPPEGAGLNPLLQNPWMVIHPPILFIGYAAVTLPFVIILAALHQRDYSSWVQRVFPWALFSSLTLGAGIIIGGYWAYGVLGWGGYWGWDPVENSSLIAWLSALAFFHGLIITRRFNALPKINMVLGVISFALVMYATFLTRSGVLADFSVHSFQDLGINGILVLFILLVLAGGFGLLASRFKSVQGGSLRLDTINRQSLMVFGIFLFLGSGFLTILGTSSPLITELFGKPAQVDISFYDKVNLPVAIIMALIIAFAPFFRWKDGLSHGAWKTLLPAMVVALVASLAGFAYGIQQFLLLIFLFASVLAISVNIILLVDRWRTSRDKLVAPLAHLGLALLFAGVVLSSGLDREERAILSLGSEKSILGYKFTFDGVVPSADGKNKVVLSVNENNTVKTVEPRLYFNKVNRGMMREPDILSGLTKDLYVSPLEIRQTESQPRNEFVLSKGEKYELSEYSITFAEFAMSKDHQSELFTVGVKLDVMNGDKKYQITPALLLTKNGQEDVPAELNDSQRNLKFHVKKIDADNGKALLEVTGLELDSPVPAPPQLLVEVSIKPFIGLLWLGSILLSIGTLWAMRNRFLELSN